MSYSEKPSDAIRKRVAALRELLGREPTLEEVFFRDFTATGKWRVVEFGVPPRGEQRGRKPTS